MSTLKIETGERELPMSDFQVDLFFKHFGDLTLSTIVFEGYDVDVESLYQAFKSRLIIELKEEMICQSA